MSYLLIDDGFADHPKVVPLSDKAFRLHVCALVLSAKNELDGAISELALALAGANAQLARPKTVANALVTAGLWASSSGANGGGYQIHDYLEYNPSRRQLAENRVKARQRKQRSRAKRHSVTDNVTDGVTSQRSHSEQVPPKGEPLKGVPFGDHPEKSNLADAWALFLASHSWDDSFNDDMILDELRRRRQNNQGFLADREALEAWQHARSQRYPDKATE